MGWFTNATNVAIAETRGRQIMRLFVLWGALVALVGIWSAMVAAVNAASPAGTSRSKGASPNAPMCGPNWQVVSSPNVGTDDNKLNSVDAALIGGDVWGVGFYYDTSVAEYRTLIERESGGQWTVVSSPNRAGGHNYLEGVADLFANDAWAVGYGGTQPGVSLATLTEHWNGTSWNIVASPNLGSANYLNSVTINAPTDAWAAGFYSSGSGYRTLIEHWNGSQWSGSPSPNVGTGDNELWSTAVVSANNAWAVGWYDNGTADRTLALHWNGSTWSTVTTPNANGSTSDNHLRSVTVISANDIWAVGYYYNTVLGKDQTLILHWNGAAWSIVASTNASPSNNYLYAVEKASASDIWAAGYYFDLNSNEYQTLVEHWNGSGWSVVPSPNAGTSYNYLYGIAVASASDVWAVGNQGSTDYTTLTERYNPCTGTATPTNGPRHTDTPTSTPTSTPTDSPTPLPTQTPGGSTATPIPTNTATSTSTNTPTSTTTNTPSATPTACVMNFSDVQPLNWYYHYVEWAKCHGISGGYNTVPPCDTPGAPCWKPSNNVTRGQLSKMISIAAGYNDFVTQQTFTDVPIGSTFYDYIERVYLHGVVSGYTHPEQCGNAVPCFRPGDNVTRGQTAKFISNAAGYNDTIPPNQQTFEDVVYGDTFWLYIERAYAHGVVSGYTDYGIYHPCANQGVGSPCFLPGNNVTREQAVKVIYLSLCPNC